jgi:uncharacterized protein YaiL (DUF2058 family)
MSQSKNGSLSTTKCFQKRRQQLHAYQILEENKVTIVHICQQEKINKIAKHNQLARQYRQKSTHKEPKLYIKLFSWIPENGKYALEKPTTSSLNENPKQIFFL